MKIAITGASGHIGSALVPLLLAAGHSLRLLTRDSSQSDRWGGEPWSGQPSPDTGKARIEYLPGDLLDKDSLERLVSGADAVIHLAAIISTDDRKNEMVIRVNTTGTRSLADAALQAGVRRFIHISSVTAFQQGPYDERMDESRDLLQSARFSYDYSKAVSQAMVLEYANRGMEVIVLAPTAVIGPHDEKPSLLGQAIVKLYTGKIPALLPGGVDFVDVRDVAGAITAALTGGTPGKVYLLSGEWVSLAAFSRHVGLIRGKKLSLPIVPVWLVFVMLPVVKLLAGITATPPFYSRMSVDNLIHSNKKVDHSLASAELQFRPRPFTTTLRDTIEWFKQKGAI
jgi:dihydroflavonol-4-reductase